MYKKKQYHVDIRQRAIALAGIYKEMCTTEPCENYTEEMDKYFSDSSFDSVENEYASIASLSSPLGEHLEPKIILSFGIFYSHHGLLCGRYPDSCTGLLLLRKKQRTATIHRLPSPLPVPLFSPIYTPP